MTFLREIALRTYQFLKTTLVGMALSTSKVASQLSNRQRRMLQDMGIDVFTERRTPADARSDIQELTEKTMPLNVSLPNAAPSPSAEADTRFRPS